MEPERPIEKLLRGYAQRRRQHAEPAQALHETQRQVLLGEVRRQFRSQNRWEWWPRWWPKVAWALGCLLILGVAAAVWLPPALIERDVSTAKTEGLRSSRSATKYTKPAGEGGNSNLPSLEMAATTSAQEAEGIDTASATLESLPETNPLTVAAAPVASMPPAPVAPTSAMSYGVSGSTSSETAVVVQQFTQIAQRAGGESVPELVVRDTAQPVLTAFRMEQIGSQVRVVDNDGSVYSGSLQAPVVPTSPEEDRRRTRSLAAPQPRASQQALGANLPAEANPDQQYLFRVVGTNRSLNQKVVFTGNLIENTQSNQASGQMPQVRQQVPRQMLLNNSRISGRAQVGAQEFPVNAVPAPPP